MTLFKNSNITALAIIAALLGATAEGLYMPLDKIFLTGAGTFMSLSLMFFGAGLGMLIILLFGRKSIIIFDPNRHVRKTDTGKIIGIIGFTIAANLLLNMGLIQESAVIGSILQNLITVLTFLFAAYFLKEKISKRLGVGAGLIILGSVALSITSVTAFSVSLGTLFIIGSCAASSGLYVIMKLLADRNPVECAILRGFGIGILALIPAICLGEEIPSFSAILGLMGVGFVGCGLSTLFLMYGQRYLGAAKAGAIFSIYPLIGAFLAIPLLGEMPTVSFLAALIFFVPGMYFIITKENRDRVHSAEEQNASDKEDTQFLVSISNRGKTAMRNYITSLGLLSVALFFAVIMLYSFGTNSADAAALLISMHDLEMILGMFTLLCGILLLILGKRVFAAVTFILMSSQIFSSAILGEIPILSVLSAVFSFLFAGILLTSQNPQKYAFALVNILLGVASLSTLIHSTVSGCIMAAAVVFLIWLSVACGSGKLHFSLSKYLIEDNCMTFGRCGAMIAFLLLAKSMAILLLYKIINQLFGGVPEGVVNNLVLINSLLIIFVGLLLMFVGKRQVTAVFFIGVGISFCLNLFAVDFLSYLPAFILLSLGVLTVLRDRALILPAGVVIGVAFTTMLYYLAPSFPEIESVLLLINGAIVILNVYLSFAVFAEKPKLPLF